MKSIKVITSQKVFITHIYGLHHYRGTWWHDKYPDDIRPVSRCLKHVWCYRSHGVPYAGFQVLKAFDLNRVDNVLHMTPQEKIQCG
jgi:hypothetical protein